MREYRLVIITLIAAVSVVACVMIFTGGLADYKRNAGDSGTTVTSSASCDFESDLIVWKGSFSVRGNTSKKAYGVIKKDARLVEKHLEGNQVPEDKMTFSSISISQKYTSRYDDEGRYLGDEPDGYELVQTMTVSSYDIGKVEAIPRDISTLIEAGVELEPNQPKYYYTKLDEMKLDLIEKTTANIKKQVDTIVSGTRGTPGTLLGANLGVSRIAARNSSSESYSYDGALDTSLRPKMVMITVRLNYSAQ